MKQPRISALEDPNCENFEVETALRLASAFDVGLIVRFAPYSEVVEWAGEVSDDKLLAVSFEDDEIMRPKTTATSRFPTSGELHPFKTPAMPGHGAPSATSSRSQVSQLSAAVV